MTLSDIGRLMKLAKVAQSKTIENLYPNPSMQIFVPAASYIVVQEVVGRMQTLGQKITVGIMSRETCPDVRPGEHLYVKVKGPVYNKADYRPDYYEGVELPPAFQRRAHAKRRRRFNNEIVVECATFRQ